MGMLFSSPLDAILYCSHMLRHFGKRVVTEKWQGINQNTEMWEVYNTHLQFNMPQTVQQMQKETRCDLPWAEDHFNERMSRVPLNPGEQYKNWPSYTNKAWNDKNFRNVDEKFTHTYMERYWPKSAGGKTFLSGIRYPYGDIDDVVALLYKEPYTRQAYIPVWFPEDTGVRHGGRVPCTIGYHIMIRDNKLHLHYLIRACDYIRHFKNDIYLTMRLAHWILWELKHREPYKTAKGPDDDFWANITLGEMTMDIINLHVFYHERNII
jgi:hypothetical protein